MKFNLMGVTVRFCRLLFVICLLLSPAGTVCFFATDVVAGTYLDSAHGSTTYGVDSVAAGSVKGNCAHCHEQHASVVTGAKDYLLFDNNNTDQATNFCFDCHTSTGAYQQVNNYSYSYRAGGWSGSPVTNVKANFNQASSHFLEDIVKFAATPLLGWKYTAVFHGDPADSNACAICHDPHLVKGDPANNSSSAKSGATRPGVITEINSSPINLWGDGLNPDLSANPNELMNIYNYQAPYRFSGGTYEPAGPTQDGSDLPNYVAFCTKCHNASNTIYSTNLSRDLKVIDWSADKHGQAAAEGSIQMNLPYPATFGKVLSCLDCHEPHGSGNQSLIRGEVNGAVTGVVSGGQFDGLCRQCHNPAGGLGDWHDPHHVNDQAFSKVGGCDSQLGCHLENSVPVTRINCANCHFHGAVSGVDPFSPVAKPLNLPTSDLIPRGNF